MVQFTTIYRYLDDFDLLGGIVNLTRIHISLQINHSISKQFLGDKIGVPIEEVLNENIT